MQLEFSALKFRKMRSRWMKLEKELISYVVVHELAHLVHMNHSKDFHVLVAHYLPDSKQIRKRLKAVNITL